MPFASDVHRKLSSDERLPRCVHAVLERTPVTIGHIVGLQSTSTVRRMTSTLLLELDRQISTRRAASSVQHLSTDAKANDIIGHHATTRPLDRSTSSTRNRRQHKGSVIGKQHVGNNAAHIRDLIDLTRHRRQAIQQSSHSRKVIVTSTKVGNSSITNASYASRTRSSCALTTRSTSQRQPHRRDHHADRLLRRDAAASSSRQQSVCIFIRGIRRVVALDPIITRSAHATPLHHPDCVARTHHKLVATSNDIID